MCQDKRLLVKYGRSGESFNITNVGVPRTWILLDIYPTINFFCNHNILTEVAHMEGAIVICCNTVTVFTSLAGVIPGFEKETKWYHPQGITN